MKLWPCAREAAVRDAAATGRWTSDLRAHATGCQSCHAVETVTGLLVFTPTNGATVTIDPEVLFQKARHARRIQVEAQMARIMTTGQVGAFVVVLAALALFFFTHPFSVASAISR